MTLVSITGHFLTSNNYCNNVNFPRTKYCHVCRHYDRPCLLFDALLEVSYAPSQVPPILVESK